MVIVRWLRSVVSGLGLLLVIVGLPAGLVVLQRAAQWDWRQVVVDPLSDSGVVAALSAAGWLLWLTLLWMVVLDIIDTVRHVERAPRLPVPAHAAVTALVSGVLLAVEALRAGGTASLTDHHERASSVTAPPATALPTTQASAVSSLPDMRGGGPAAVEHVSSRSTLTVAGLDVPGGWLPVPVAAAVTAAAALVWAHRRRQYLPRPPGGWLRNDADLAPLPTVVDRIVRLTRSAIDADPDLTATPLSDAHGRASDPAADSRVPDTVPNSVPDAATAWPVEVVLPGAGVALVGPGAEDAARGLLVAATIGQAVGTRVLVSRRLWTMLLGPATAAGASERIQVIADEAESPAPTSSGSVWATVVVLVDAAAHTQGAARQLASGDDSTTRTVVVGVASTMHSWQVAADGRLYAVAGPAPVVDRLPVLNLSTARTLLGALGVLTTTGGDLDSPAADSVQSTERHHVPSTVPGVGSADASNGRPGHEVPAPADLPAWPDPPPQDAGHVRRLLVRVLGVPVVLMPHPDGSLSAVHIRRSAGQQILVLLIVHPAGLSAADLKDAIWPTTPSSAAHRHFLTTVSELRRSLHDAAGRPVLLQRRRPGDPDGSWYRLDPAAVQVDLWRFRSVLDAAAVTTDPIHRYHLLTEAADLAGDLAQGWDHEWLATAREHIARHQMDVLTHLAGLAPDQPTAIQLLQQAQHVSPTNEVVHRELMALHAAAGDTNAMRRAAATYTEHLARQFAEHLITYPAGDVAEQHATQDPARTPLTDPPPRQAAHDGPSVPTRG
ncbi:hypothetical protein Daura_06445 [Dactylosporangium aurantiacum]|uniref:Bacterial transcriptional activator domain-containing protein n=1 Tax=Dactylosporangium aurantiacum TaxID=35754 RepID=A0A9Q9IL45_9ACTN|nr:hypothetical protein [Dactylosporangium aurantiacum]MDG6106128.1 hypothetical protein [Dactylosporangium aurantiacum]UWZ55837.1 hypothetical protein Daura_06445 [Dactylosporangium aurantiacum]